MSLSSWGNRNHLQEAIADKQESLSREDLADQTLPSRLWRLKRGRNNSIH